MTPSKVFPTVHSTQDFFLVPGGKVALEDKKDSDDYPFKRDLEDLLCSPKERPSDEALLEEEEIEVSHSLLGSLNQ